MTNPDERQPGTGPDADATVEDIQADIEATRHELGQTVEALSAKLDVSAQAKQKVDDAKQLVVDAATDDDGSIRAALPAAVFVVFAIVVGAVIWHRRR